MNDPFSQLDGGALFSEDISSEDRYSVDQEILFGGGSAKAERKSYIDSSFSSSRARIFFIIIILCFVGILGRLTQVQIVEGDWYFARAERNRQRTIPIVAERGLIYDRNGELLTQNVPNFSLTLVPQDLPRKTSRNTVGPSRDEVITRLSEITLQDTESLSDTLDEFGAYSYESITLREDIDYDQALRIHIDAADLPGITIAQGSKRLYLHEVEDVITGVTSSVDSISHMLGYMGKLNREELDELYDKGYLPSDSLGKTGVEYQYEQQLRGTYGRRRVEVDSMGRKQLVLSEEAPVPGLQMRLAIDLQIQAALQRFMQEELDRRGLARAAAVAIDPRDGKIRALVSLPTYDNNEFSGGIDRDTYKQYIEDENRPLFHRAIGGTYPSGSVIKPAIAAGALQENIITRSTTFISTGGLAIGQWFFPDWQPGGHGRTDVRKSIANSVNTFYYMIGGGYGDFVGMGVAKIKIYIEAFGLAEELGIDLPGERSGNVPSKAWKEEKKGERWYVGDTYNLSIGQGDLLVTPLQMASVTASIANGGTVYAPQVLEALVNPVTGDEYPMVAEVKRTVPIHDEHLQTVRLGMRDCVTYGSCRRLNSVAIPVAGKTGTAQWNRNKENHAWFTSFAPFDNPEIAIAILVEEGEGGSISAVPIGDRFYRWWAAYRLLDE
ncbi:MAG: penicillin-binding protein 2 [Candidatus Magasanikbacteria bacterium]|jgi:penicillin-binding protein 2|nr:penicillin-binding protein 2 [Candidatus Magasanikbacteria bacterium]